MTDAATAHTCQLCSTDEHVIDLGGGFGICKVCRDMQQRHLDEIEEQFDRPYEAPTEITPFIFLGSVNSTVDADEMRALGITRVLIAASGLKAMFPDEFEYLTIPWADQLSQRIAHELPRALAFVQGAEQDFALATTSTAATSGAAPGAMEQGGGGGCAASGAADLPAGVGVTPRTTTSTTATLSEHRDAATTTTSDTAAVAATPEADSGHDGSAAESHGAVESSSGGGADHVVSGEHDVTAAAGAPPLVAQRSVLPACAQPPRILIHCHAGVSRSTTIVIAHLMRRRQWTYDQAHAFVKARRPIVSPNSAFARQLRALQPQLLAMATGSLTPPPLLVDAEDHDVVADH